MRRMRMLVGALLLAVGCTAADKAQWQEAMKDARGDNMKMRGPDSSSSSKRSTSSAAD